MMMTTRAGKFMIHSVLHASLILLTVPFRRKCRKMPLTATVKLHFWTKELSRLQAKSRRTVQNNENNYHISSIFPK